MPSTFKLHQLLHQQPLPQRQTHKAITLSSVRSHVAQQVCHPQRRQQVPADRSRHLALQAGEVGNAVEIAVKGRLRHLDLAKIYQNQTEIGEALKKVIPSVVKREELFITSKLWNTSHKPENVEAAYNETLKELGLDYLDLYLIHWPVAFKAGF